ncbi:hypothetical protein ACHAW5_010639 [Stephanodiscus triporus]|uniref:Small RNA 2'-O-methyltransferase n=1 Tax=Stephanodiscus triporus TaxID=2934178 RepID=A0ABD3QDZ5_9STRA
MSSSRHYGSHTASSYESAYFYSPGEYNDWLCDLVLDALALGGTTTTTTTTTTMGGGLSSSSSSGSKEEDDREKRRGRPRGRRRLVLLDVGGGTGNFTRAIVERVGMGGGGGGAGGGDRLDAIVVDPFLSPAASVADTEGVRFVRADARDFIPTRERRRAVEGDDHGRDHDGEEEWEWEGEGDRSPSHSWKRGYDRVLLKEVVHHLDPADRVGIFKGLRDGFSIDNEREYDECDGPSPIEEGKVEDGDEAKVGGKHDDGHGGGASLLVITRPRFEIDYPLWQEAREAWARDQPGADDIECDLRAAGFANVTRRTMTYSCAVSLEAWLRMVRNRFWSTFSHFTDEELDGGCARIAEDARADEEGMVHFEERLVFISARAYYSRKLKINK